MKKAIAFVASLVLACVVCTGAFASAVSEVPSSPKYVASTSWVAAIAELAGLDDVVTIAPANLKHPPEYEITADDLATVMHSELFLYAGYERMMESIRSAAGLDEEKSIKCKTQNNLNVLSGLVDTISAKAGTQDKAAQRYGAYVAMIEEARAKVKQLGIDQIPAYVNTNQTPLAEDLGLNIVAIFGAGELTSDQIADAARNQYALIIDNVHAVVTDPLKSVCPESTILIWRNFPEYTGNNALYTVVEENLKMLFDAFAN